MKVNIIGWVYNDKGRVEGILDVPEDEAQRLISLGVAEPALGQVIKEKAYKNMNVAEQTVVINETETIEALEALRADTKATALPVLEEKIKSLQQPEQGQA